MSDITVGALKGLANALRKQEAALTAQWIKHVIGDPEVAHSGDMSYTQIADHVPAIFDEICLVLESQDMDSQEDALVYNARQHGKYRWEQGYRIDEVVRELDLFRHVLMGAISEFAVADRSFSRKREHRARVITDQVISFVTLTSIREAVGERDRKLATYTGMLESANRELTARQHELGEIYESRMQVARRVAHDLRNFLNVFSTALQTIDRAPERKDAAMKLVNRQVADMAALVDEMGEYSKVLSDHAGSGVETFDLKALFDELMQLCSETAREKGLALMGHIDATLGPVTSNRLKMKQVALNLLSNALKYTTAGEVRLQLLDSDNTHWVFRVSDTGVGIDEADSERVFEEFERAATDDIPGTGLGLAIVKELSRTLGGTLRFESEKGRGSVFEVRFPKERGAPEL